MFLTFSSPHSCVSACVNMCKHAISRAGTYAMEMTIKSSQFQASLRKVKSSMTKPRARILVRDSNV